VSASTPPRHPERSEGARPQELELKAVVPDPVALRLRFLAVGAVPVFAGTMTDRRYDRAAELTARDEVLRLRTFARAGGADAVLGWKGPARTAPGGYKQREEIELPLARGGGAPEAFLAALGYEVVHTINRWVEVFELDGTVLRLEGYPLMDDLLEVEGEPAAIERVIAASGIAREEFSSDSLAEFVRRFESRTGRTARLTAGERGMRAPAWASA
jgi:adenylate cyclase class IV